MNTLTRALPVESLVFDKKVIRAIYHPNNDTFYSPLADIYPALGYAGKWFSRSSHPSLFPDLIRMGELQGKAAAPHITPTMLIYDLKKLEDGLYHCTMPAKNRLLDYIQGFLGNRGARIKPTAPQPSLEGVILPTNPAETPVGQTMSSLEIADLCSQIPGTKAKEHKHIMRDIRDMFGTLGISTESKIGLCEKINELGLKRSYSYYILTREESDILISGYSIPYRAAIIRRWHDLEKQVVTPKLDRHDGDFKKLAETVAGLSLVMAELIKRVG